MSRSVRHTPRCGDRKSGYGKRQAARAVRRTGDVSGLGRGGYRKLYERWSICDHEEIGTTFGQWWGCLRSRAAPGEGPDRRTAWMDYQRWYVRK